MSASNQARQPAQIDGPAGSPDSGEPVFLVVGKLRKPHGLHGELRMEVITDFPERLQPGVTVYAGADYHPIRIRSRRWHGSLLLIAFEGYTDPESAGVLRNRLVSVRADDRPPLPEGEFYHHQLLGLDVVSDEGEALGEVVQILETGANDVYIVRPQAGPDLLLPAIDEVVLDVDLAEGSMRVHLLPGLRPD
jgi:16S rRNA processing protein RimM